MKSNILKSKRAILGLSQSDVADKLKISKSAYCKRENGLKDFKSSEIKSLMITLDLSNNNVIEIFFAD